MKPDSIRLLTFTAAAVLLLRPVSLLLAQPPEPTREPLVRVVDLNIGEAAELKLANGESAHVKLLKLDETRDSLRNAVRSATVVVDVNGELVTLNSANYTLPQTVAGVQVDCPITKGYNSNSARDVWSLEKDARLRLWPAGSPLMEPGTFVYPLKQRWFATHTQFANEPTYADGGEKPQAKSIYYHNDLDFGGCEGLIDVVSATDGRVVSCANQTLPGFENTPARPRYDVVYVLDDRGWYYRYSHLSTIEASLAPGAPVKMGQRIGVLGKEGASGGWSHLHFGIVSRQPSGKWGTQEAYALVWEAYLREYKPKIIAVARPHHLAAVGETVRLDASKSWSAAGQITRYQWQFEDGRRSEGSIVERTYPKPGTFSEILRVEDAQGNVAYDFAAVQILDAAKPDQLPPTIHPSYAPTTGIRSGDKIAFKVRTFRTTEGEETWYFGDNTPPVRVKSDGNAKALAPDGYAVTEHAYQKPGIYIVRVQRTNDRGETATGHLAVTVEQ